MSLMPFAIAWLVLGMIVAILALMRRSITMKEDDSVHLSGAAVVVASEQQTTAKKLDAIDKWGKILTIVLVITGVIIAIVFGIQAWEESAHVGLR